MPCPRTQHRNNVSILRGEKHDIPLKILHQLGFGTSRQAATLSKLRARRKILRSKVDPRTVLSKNIFNGRSLDPERANYYIKTFMMISNEKNSFGLHVFCNKNSGLLACLGLAFTTLKYIYSVEAGNCVSNFSFN